MNRISFPVEFVEEVVDEPRATSRGRRQVQGQYDYVVIEIVDGHHRIVIHVCATRLLGQVGQGFNGHLHRASPSRHAQPARSSCTRPERQKPRYLTFGPPRTSSTRSSLVRPGCDVGILRLTGHRHQPRYGSCEEWAIAEEGSAGGSIAIKSSDNDVPGLQRPAAPSHDKASGKVTMRDDYNVFGIFTLFIALRARSG